MGRFSSPGTKKNEITENLWKFNGISKCCFINLPRVSCNLEFLSLFKVLNE